MNNEAEQRLRLAKDRLQEISSSLTGLHPTGDWDALRPAQQEVLAAERELARAHGRQYAVELDPPLRWDPGAPLPHLLTNGHDAYLMFYLPDRDPDWDGTSVRIMDPASDGAVPLGMVKFSRVHSMKLGGPNDEALHGHPLTGQGLRPYGAHRVLNSQWIAEEERINSVHPHHRGGWHERLNHYVFCFHDETFECIAQALTVERHLTSPRALLHDLANRLLQ